jgi:DtxR family Mn-dependent transcriptional regulator
MPEQYQASESVENFLKAVYALQQVDERVSTNDLSQRLGISAPSVTDMAQRMMAEGLIDYQKYRGVRLTGEGERIALHVLRRHRLIELFLVRELGYPLADVHAEAEALEHAVSDTFVEALAAKLGDPAVDPHGESIPTADGTIDKRDLLPLSDLPMNTPARISQFTTRSADMLQYILDRGFGIDQHVVVTARDPFDGPVTAELDGRRTIIGQQAAACIYVERA